MKEVHYGIDLSGYSSGKTVVAELTRGGDGGIGVRLDYWSLSRKFRGKDRLQEALAKDVEGIRTLLENPLSRIGVDIPLDLQGLDTFSPGGQFVWALTRRPIDHALGAMPPLADRIGAPVARFQALLKAAGLEGEVGRRIYETYPSGSLKLMGLEHRGYKGQRVLWEGSGWRPATRGSERLCALATEINLTSDEEGRVLTDDGLDAILSGLACFDDFALEGKELIQAVEVWNPGSDYCLRPSCLPRGFRLVKGMGWHLIMGSWDMPQMP
jgi:hypothetical protein